MMLIWFQITDFLKEKKERRGGREERREKRPVICPGKAHSGFWSSVEANCNAWLKCPISLDQHIPSCLWLWALLAPERVTLPLDLSCMAFPLHNFQDHMVSLPTPCRFRGKFDSEAGKDSQERTLSSACDDLFYFEFSYRVLVRKYKSTPSFDRWSPLEGWLCGRSQDDTEMSFQIRTRTAEELQLPKKWVTGTLLLPVGGRDRVGQGG